MPRPPTKPRPGEPSTKAPDSKTHSKEFERAKGIVRSAITLFEMTHEGFDLEHVKTHGLAMRDGGYVLLNLDTEKDEMVAKLYSAAGCTCYTVEGRYCRHTDEAGREYFYKIDPQDMGSMSPSLLHRGEPIPARRKGRRV